MLRTSSFILPAFLFSAVLYGQDTLNSNTTHRLNEIVIYSANEFQPATHIDVEDSAVFVKSTGQEASSIFAETPSVSIYSDAGTTQGYSYIRMRGIDQTRINITYDGVPLNEPEDQGAYFSNYPDLLASVSKIQVQRGVGTTKNGVASYGGSIQMHSAKFTDSLNAFAGLGYGSYNNMHAYGGINTPLGEKFNLYLRAAEVYSDGYKHHSSNHSQSIVGSLAFHNDHSVVRLNIISGHQQNELGWLGVSDSLIKIDRRANANGNEKDNFQQHLIQLYVSTTKRPTITRQTSFYYTFLNGNYDFDLNNFLGLPSTEEMYNYAFRSDLIGVYTNIAWSPGAFRISGGLHANLYKRSHTGSANSTGQLYSNQGYKREANTFVRASYNLGALTIFGDMELRVALFDYIGADTPDTFEWMFFNPKGGATYKLNDHNTLYYTIGMTGREPTRNDIFGGNDNPLVDSLGQVITFITQAEQVIDHELGLTYSGNRFKGTINVYLMSFRNEIVLNGKFGPNGLPLTNNVDLSFRSGMELTVVFDFSPHLRSVLNASYNYSNIKENDVMFKPILTPPCIGTLELVWYNSDFEISLTGRYQSGAYIDYANTNKIDGFFLLNSRVSYLYRNFRFSAFANNCTSAKYYSSGYVDFDGSAKYFVQAPFNFHTSVQFSW